MFNTKSILVAAALLAASMTVPANAEGVQSVAPKETNRILVLKFFDLVFNQHDLVAGAAMMADNYIQHAPHSPNGKMPFVKRFTGFLNANPDSKVRIVRSAADGDLVWLHGHATRNSDDRGVSLLEIFRVKDGLIVEHWGLIVPVPEKSANDNTVF